MATFTRNKPHVNVGKIGHSILYRGVSRKEKPRRHHGLNQQKRQEMKEAFDLFDTDGALWHH
ncbi:unnamed protein product [Eruca vesicaria subsp. sativa]|uniref:Uncharacterized protein n=1 Tax=Eruca vesicaria subsp. sativa TaxID=29727 RepID=A0ABC8K0E9_ERUVS|nr:unnamed protein product [Eruca vesicaria subsp. sativa]